MRTNIVRAGVISGAVAVVAMAGSGLASADTAAPAAAETAAVSTTADGDVQAKVIGYSHTFNHKQSIDLYNAAIAGGAGAAGALCATWGGAWAGVGCAAVGKFVLDEVTSPPGKGRCVKVRINVAPTGAFPSVVDCP